MSSMNFLYDPENFGALRYCLRREWQEIEDHDRGSSFYANSSRCPCLFNYRDSTHRWHATFDTIVSALRAGSVDGVLRLRESFHNWEELLVATQQFVSLADGEREKLIDGWRRELEEEWKEEKRKFARGEIEKIVEWGVSRSLAYAIMRETGPAMALGAAAQAHRMFSSLKERSPHASERAVRNCLNVVLGGLMQSGLSWEGKHDALLALG